MPLLHFCQSLLLVSFTHRHAFYQGGALCRKIWKIFFKVLTAIRKWLGMIPLRITQPYALKFEFPQIAIR